MASLPYIQLYVADYLADTAHLKAVEHGAYLLLIMNYWQTGKPLNNSNDRLTNVARMSKEEWNESKKTLQEFFKVDGDTWTHLRIEADLFDVKSKATKASDAGKKSAEARRLAKFNVSSTDVKQTFNHTDTDTDTEINTHVSSDAGRHACPHEKIISLYHEVLPMLPAVKVWNEKRKQTLKTRWLEDEKRQSLDFWRRFFEYVAQSDFLCGRAGTFQATLEWLLNSSNFVKVIEGNYENRKAA